MKVTTSDLHIEGRDKTAPPAARPEQMSSGEVKWRRLLVRNEQEGMPSGNRSIFWFLVLFLFCILSPPPSVLRPLIMGRGAVLREQKISRHFLASLMRPSDGQTASFVGGHHQYNHSILIHITPPPLPIVKIGPKWRSKN